MGNILIRGVEDIMYKLFGSLSEQQSKVVIDLTTLLEIWEQKYKQTADWSYVVKVKKDKQANLR